MKHIIIPGILLLFIMQTSDAFSQDCAKEESLNLSAIKQTNFSNSVFNEEADFWDKLSDSIVDFSNAEFKKPAEFNNSKFNSYVNFSNAKFYASADFQCVQFLSDVNFSRTSFESNVDFLQVKFKSTTDFSYSKFSSISSFKKAKFNSIVNFSNATFKNHVNFNQVEFNADANFTDVIFDSMAVFEKAKFNADANFTSTTLPKYLDFSYTTKISNEIDLTSAFIDEKYGTCYINLNGAAIDKFRFRYKRFKLWFPPGDTKIDYDLKSNVYEVLLEKQKDEGFTLSYEKLDREYKEFKYTEQKGSEIKRIWGNFQNWVDKNWWGYGYEKWLIIQNSVILYVLFSFLNVFFLKHLTRRVYEADKINEYWEEVTGSKLSKFFKSIPFSLFYTAEIFFGFKFDLNRLKYKENLQGWKIFNLVYFITIYLSGLVCIAYLANYVITV